MLLSVLKERDLKMSRCGIQMKQGVVATFQMGLNKSEVKQMSYPQVSLVKSVLLFGSSPSPNASSL